MPKVLPRVLFIGPGRTGTTWIHEYLRARGDVVLPENAKETFFFDRYFDRGIDWYANLFPDADAGTARIEVGPTYAFAPEAAGRVARMLPDARAIFTFRNPVERSISLYWHIRRYGEKTGPIEQYITPDSILIRSSRYAEQMERWTQALGADRVHYLLSDELRADPVVYVQELCKAANLPYQTPAPAMADKRVNQRVESRSPKLSRLASKIRKFVYDHDLRWVATLARKVNATHALERPVAESTQNSVDESTRAKIYALLKDDIAALERRLGRTFPDWHLKP